LWHRGELVRVVGTSTGRLLITGSCAGILPEDDIMKHNFYPGNTNNRENHIELTPPSGRGPMAGGEDDARDDSSSSSDDSSSGSSVHSHRSISKLKKVKKIKKRADIRRTGEQQEWEKIIGIVTPEISSKM